MPRTSMTAKEWAIMLACKDRENMQGPCCHNEHWTDLGECWCYKEVGHKGECECICGETWNVTNLEPVPLKGTLTATSWVPPHDLSFDDWVSVGNTLKQMARSTLWWVGDWLIYGERKWGEMYAQALDATDYSYQTLRDAKWVAGKIETSRRKDDLSFSHHKEVASLETQEQNNWLDKAIEEGWSRNNLRHELIVYKRKLDGKPEPTPLDHLQYWWGKANIEEECAFLDWLQVWRTQHDTT